MKVFTVTNFFEFPFRNLGSRINSITSRYAIFIIQIISIRNAYLKF